MDSVKRLARPNTAPAKPTEMHFLQEDHIQEPLNINLGERLDAFRAAAVLLCYSGLYSLLVCMSVLYSLCVCYSGLYSRLLCSSVLYSLRLCYSGLYSLLFRLLLSFSVLIRPTDTLPPPFDLYPRPSDTPQYDPNSDWATFITAYACGRWDPNEYPVPRVCLPPRIRSCTGSKGRPGVRAHCATSTAVPPPPNVLLHRIVFCRILVVYVSPFSLPGSFPFPSSTTTT
ncbi:hypothetical protein B0H12DRAFT_708750, partial [Mycena haematopus]